MHKFTKHDEKVLGAFLQAHRRDGALGWVQTQGFLVCLACCPDLIQPSDWVPQVLGEAVFKHDREMTAVMAGLMALYNQVNQQILQGSAKLPKACRVLPDTRRNFAEPAPLHQWSQGFMTGYVWLGAHWRGLFAGDAEGQRAFDMTVFVLGLAADWGAFERAFASMTDENRLTLAKSTLAAMPTALRELTQLARAWRAAPAGIET